MCGCCREGDAVLHALCVFVKKKKDVFSFIRQARLTETTHTHRPSRCYDYESSSFKYFTIIYMLFFFIASLKGAFQDHSEVLHTRLLSPLGTSSKSVLRDTDYRKLYSCTVTTGARSSVSGDKVQDK